MVKQDGQTFINTKNVRFLEQQENLFCRPRIFIAMIMMIDKIVGSLQSIFIFLGF